jgi:hypothetical protein
MGTQRNRWINHVNEETDWRDGWGFLARLRTIWGFLGLDVVTVVTLATQVSWYWSVVAATALTSASVGLIVFRRHRLREMRTWARFHSLCHDLRDESSQLRHCVIESGFPAYAERFQGFHGRACNLIASFFRALVGDDSINCALRLASTGDGTHNVYVTYGRSDAMDRSREVNTCPLGDNEGIAKKLLEASKLGVCLISDLDEARKMQWWKSDKNDILEDVRYLMVAPVNSPNEDGNRDMLGILYVTSKHDCFRLSHVEPIKGIADLLGMLYPSIAFEPMAADDANQVGDVA